MNCFPSAVTALALVAASLVVTACAPRELERCNSDGECGVRACVLGTCVAVEDTDDDAAGGATDDVGGRAIDDAARRAIDGDAPDEQNDAIAPGCSGVRVFVDGDGDGRGAGQQLCEAALGPGRALVGGDCDDDDAGAFELRTLHVDEDGDGFTAGEVTRCVGDARPAGLAPDARSPPMHVVEAARVQALAGAWSAWTDTFAVFTGDVGEARLSSFTCASSPPATIAGLEVRVRLTPIGGSSTPVTVRATVDGASDVREASAFADGSTVVFGGANDTLGLGADVDPASLCDGTFALHIALATGAGAATIVVETSVLAHGETTALGVDCDDLDAARFSAAALRDDGDGDGFAAGTPLDACIGLALPAGKRVRARDCDDADVEAFPLQSRRFQRQRAGGGFDFNCNAVEELSVQSVRHITRCFRNNNGACREDHTMITPACGETFDFVDRCTAGCNKHWVTGEQTCR